MRSPAPAEAAISRSSRLFYRVVGGACLVLATLGVVLPLLPTTPFVILAAWCFTRASPELHEALLNHRRFGPALRDWQEHRAIPRKAKIVTVISMVVSWIFAWIFAPHWAAPVIAGLVMLATGTYVVTRPEPPPRPLPIEEDLGG